jgi:hypothetical protein
MRSQITLGVKLHCCFVYQGVKLPKKSVNFRLFLVLEVSYYYLLLFLVSYYTRGCHITYLKVITETQWVPYHVIFRK